MHIAFAGADRSLRAPPLAQHAPPAVVEWLLRRDEAVRSRARLMR